MMNTTYETYMNALKQGLASFDSAAAEEILNDFESHFADARSQGLSDEEICAELGNVDDVLEFFRQEYATTEQPVANVLPQEKTHSNSEETHPNYPVRPFHRHHRYGNLPAERFCRLCSGHFRFG